MNNPAQIPSLPPLQDRLKEITDSGIAPTMEHLRGEFMALFRLEQHMAGMADFAKDKDPEGLAEMLPGMISVQTLVKLIKEELVQANPGRYAAIVNEAESPHLISDLTRFALVGVLQRVEKAPHFADKDGVVSGLKAVLEAM